MKKRSQVILHIEEVIRRAEGVYEPELRKSVLESRWPMPVEMYVDLPASISRPNAANPTRLRITMVEEIIVTPKKKKPVTYPPHHHKYSQTGFRCPICLTENVTAYAINGAEPITEKRGKAE